MSVTSIVLLPVFVVQAALEWCLLLQEALLWQDWPALLVQGSKTPAAASGVNTPAASVHPAAAPLPAAAAARIRAAAGAGAGADMLLSGAAGAAADGDDAGVRSRVLTCWPRMKMGVAAGSPQSVMPDHMGRADYHGNAVNMASR